jgi:ribosomal-protein-alanine N-acetyltransferase
MASDPHPATSLAFKIRDFRPSDVAAISGILRTASEAAQWPAESYPKLASSPGGLLLISESEPSGQAIAFLAARVAADQAEILNIAILPDFRRRGVASAMLAAAFERFRQCSVSRVFLELRESNSAARALYQHHGFVLSGRRKSYYQHPAEDALCMHSDLTGAP